jgi:TRAP-type mannitol/chloroaromatic compound transport system permease small subunit
MGKVGRARMRRRFAMVWALSLARAVDAVTTAVGRIAAWLVLLAVLISAGNAISRKGFSLSSNAWLEAQWYLFGAVFMLGTAWTLLRNEHIRIDILASRMPKAYRDWLEVIGHGLFLIPFALIHVYLATPSFLSSFRSGEMSSNAGGLPIWPAKLMVLVGFSLLLAQGLSELIKRIAVLTGDLRLDGDGDEGVPEPRLDATEPPR